MRYSVSCCGFLPLSLPSASAYPFSALLTNNFSKSVPPRCGPFRLSLFSSRNATFLPHFRGNYRYIGVRSLSLALPILVWKHYGEIHPVPERPPLPFQGILPPRRANPFERWNDFLYNHFTTALSLQGRASMCAHLVQDAMLVWDDALL